VRNKRLRKNAMFAFLVNVPHKRRLFEVFSFRRISHHVGLLFGICVSSLFLRARRTGSFFKDTADVDIGQVRRISLSASTGDFVAIYQRKDSGHYHSWCGILGSALSKHKASGLSPLWWPFANRLCSSTAYSLRRSCRQPPCVSRYASKHAIGCDGLMVIAEC